MRAWLVGGWLALQAAVFACGMHMHAPTHTSSHTAPSIAANDAHAPVPDAPPTAQALDPACAAHAAHAACAPAQGTERLAARLSSLALTPSTTTSPPQLILTLDRPPTFLLG